MENKKVVLYHKRQEILISSLKDISFPETPVVRQEAFHKVAKTISGEVPANIFLAQKKNKEFIGGIFPERIVKHLDGWTAWDIYLEKNTLRMSGSLLRPADSLPQLPIVPSQKNTIETYAVSHKWLKESAVFPLRKNLFPKSFISISNRIFPQLPSLTSREILWQYSAAPIRKKPYATLLYSRARPSKEKPFII